MKRQRFKFTSSVLVAAALGGIIWVGAGDLNPPEGRIAPTMKTLTDVEPRIAINRTNTPGDILSRFKITQPGSYYLTGNVTGAAGQSGIVITSGQVTLDLNGFRLEGAGGTIAIELQCVPDVVIKNGFISNWIESGILGEDSTGLRIENIHMRNFPGCTVLVGSGTAVLDSSISDSADGYQLGPHSRVERCVVRGCAGTAIVASTGSLVADCTLNNNGGGISVSGAGSVVRDNVINGSGSTVISVVGATARNNRIEGNHVTGGGVGLSITTAGNYVVDNTVKSNTDNYDIAAGNNLNILLCEIPESIDWPANVTLAGSLTGALDADGLTINADDVTVDLAGFALFGAPDSTTGSGIFMSGRSNVEIRNGTIRDFGVFGIIDQANAARNHRIIGVRVVSNGFHGIFFSGRNNLVKDCTAEGNGGTGIGPAAFSIVTGNTASGNGFEGIKTPTSCTVTDNITQNNQLDGIIAGAGSTVTGNTAYNNLGNGISASSGCTVIGNTTSFNGRFGISLFPGNCLVDQNTAFNNNRSGGSTTNIQACATCTFGVNHAP